MQSAGESVLRTSRAVFWPHLSHPPVPAVPMNGPPQPLPQLGLRELITLVLCGQWTCFASECAFPRWA